MRDVIHKVGFTKGRRTGARILRVVVTLALAVLLTAGCGSDDGPSKAKDSSPDPAASASGSAGRSGSQGSLGAKGSPSPAPAQVTQGQPLPPAAVKPADSGKYAFDETGSRKFGGCGSDGPPPSPTSLVVDPANGNRQKSVRDRRDGVGQGVVATSVLEFREDGVYLIYLSQEQYTPVGRSIAEFEPVPPPLVFPSNPKKSQSWQFTLNSKDGKVKAEVSAAVEEESATVSLPSGESHAAVRIRRTSHITGASILGNLDLTETNVGWVAIAARHIVKEVTDTTGTIGTCRIESHVEATLRTTRPS